MSERLCLAVNGQSRSGKSYLVKNEIIPKISEVKPVIIFDRLGEYTSKDPDAPDWFIEHTSFEGFIDRIGGELNRKLQHAHVIQCHKDADYTNGLRFFELLKKPVCLVLDEAQDIFFDTDFRQAKKFAIKMTRYGGHYGIDIIMISQRTKDVPPDFRSQVTAVVSFRQKSVEDIKCLQYNGFDNAELISELENHKYEVFGNLPDYLTLNQK